MSAKENGEAVLPSELQVFPTKCTSDESFAIGKCPKCDLPFCETHLREHLAENHKLQYGRREVVELAPDVICVAVEGAIGDWTAYIGAQIGAESRNAENVERVATRGHKMRKGLAEFLFPEWKRMSWRA